MQNQTALYTQRTTLGTFPLRVHCFVDRMRDCAIPITTCNNNYYGLYNINSARACAYKYLSVHCITYSYYSTCHWWRQQHGCIETLGIIIQVLSSDLTYSYSTGYARAHTGMLLVVQVSLMPAANVCTQLKFHKFWNECTSQIHTYVHIAGSSTYSTYVCVVYITILTFTSCKLPSHHTVQTSHY